MFPTYFLRARTVSAPYCAEKKCVRSVPLRLLAAQFFVSPQKAAAAPAQKLAAAARATDFRWKGAVAGGGQALAQQLHFPL